MVPLIFLIFYEVSGESFGIQNSVKAAALSSFFRVQQALITAEMGTMFPGLHDLWVLTGVSYKAG
ncbi:hypothetical protein C5167_035404 [Papaver somniferum]|uniref:Uncharacterized protein n=1 Tax=Papaver somniferum TaxID=3469 RepID=A0A4Y7KFV2_PAPSO|nr:hypothetical protein C5167_035404 [Papaver somniferum]